MIAALLLGLVSAFASEPAWDSPASGQLRVGVHSGFPWHGLDLAYAPQGPLALVTELETARFRRTELRLGIRRPWEISPRWSLTASVNVGGVVQPGVVSRQGPQAGAELMLSRLGRVEAYVTVHDRELLDLEAVETQGAEGDTTTWTATRYTTRGGTLGVRVPLRPQWCLDLAFRAGKVDDRFAIPSVSAGFFWRTQP